MDNMGLVAAARRGDEDAFTKLYHRHIRYVRAIGRSILRTEDLDDMCQDTFLLAFTRLHSFEGNAQFSTWITRIAINRCLAILRKGRPASKDECQHDGEGAAWATTDVHLEGVAERVDLNRLLEGLSPVQRRALELAYLEEMPNMEIAETLRLSLAKVKNTLVVAKQKLRNPQNN